jgi:hypothetical protein
MARYVWRERVGVVAGYNLNIPIDPHSSISSDFMINQVIAGASFRFTPNVLIYTEERFDLGHDAHGSPLNNIYTLGFRVGFSTKNLVDSLLASLKK